MKNSKSNNKNCETASVGKSERKVKDAEAGKPGEIRSKDIPGINSIDPGISSIFARFNQPAPAKGAGSRGAGLMKKVRGNAAWNGLSREKRATLAKWLFEDRLTYDEALERAQKELGFAGSRTSLRRFYYRTRDERLLSGLADAGALAQTVEESGVGTEQLREAGLKLAAEVFLRQVASEPENLKEWAPLAKLLLQAERNESWRRVKDEENRLKDRALEFARMKYHYDIVTEAQHALPELTELGRANGDPATQRLEANKKINDVRRRLFGPVIPELLPETEEEQAHPEIIEARYQAGLRKIEAQFAREHWQRKKEYEAERVHLKVAAPLNPPEKDDDWAVEEDEMKTGNQTAEEDRLEAAWDKEKDGSEPESEGGYYPAGRIGQKGREK
jgi:hypothetical protein